VTTKVTTVSGGTATTMVGGRFWLPIATCPTGVKVNLLTKHGVAIAPSVISESTRKHFLGWEELARIPKEWKTP
jgi:hypothetical protein